MQTSVPYSFERFTFPDLKTLLAKASPLRSGDVLAGLATQSDEERVATRFALADVPLKRFLSDSLAPYERDDVYPHDHGWSQPGCA
ncbi:ethanolamine ammonia-lyase subunit EutB [Thalassospira sp. GB04J01]|uniref:ethanolamine ammonia-lyase subunit EutB n=1 Tax=Thalassospira sp. GB04J01 TaxID=1485225 RepID=UPI001FCB0EB0|nr:ethanolamine ammonia-lyase subunit EutB [Thalassospira sp. GB04J01]